MNKFPSLELVYNQLKNVLQYQGRVHDMYSVKATFLWGSATVILATAITVLQALSIKNSIFSFSLLVFIGSPYIIITALSWLVIVPKNTYGTAIDFNIMKEKFAVLPQTEFMIEMINHIEDAYKENKKRLIIELFSIIIAGVILLIMIGLLLFWVFKYYPYFV